MSDFVRNKLLKVKKRSLENMLFLLLIDQVFEDSDKGIFRVDDVFVTGMLAEKANVSHRFVQRLDIII